MAQTAIGKDGGLPQKLEFESRFEDGQKITIGDIRISLKKIPEHSQEDRVTQKGFVCEPVWLVCEIEDEDGPKAMERAIPYIEWACDQLSYFTQFPMKILSSEMYQIGNEQEKNVYMMPAQPAKFRGSIYMNAKVPQMIPLVPPPQNFSERDFAILRWYHKSLEAAYEVDRFVFLWVCLEILCKASDFVVKAPYVNHRCNHEIPECPVCGETTEKEVNGKTLQAFLVDELGVDVKVAKEMWRFRQLLHGQNKLTEKSTKNMERLVMALQAGVNLGIKRRFGFRDDGLPIVAPQGLSFSALGLTLRTEQ